MPIHRRDLLRGALALGAARVFSPIAAAQSANPAAPRVNPERLRKRLEDLSIFGRPAGGTFANGVSRVAYTDADVAGRKFAMEQMRLAGLEVRIDPAGNIVGRRAGSDTAAKPILFGSHIDSVPSGGNFDGDVGSMSAIEVAHTLHDGGISTRHPLEVAIWANEEGLLDGSRAAAGQLRPNESSEKRQGMPWPDAIRKIGGDPARIAEARRAPGSIHAYLELHIEQGGTLDREKVPIGVVEGIVAIDAYEAVIRGFANHAGTTPMPERKNALLAAAKLILAVQDVVVTEPGRQVGTVGKLEVKPNAQNVIPGLVTHTIELRDLSAEKIGRLGDEVKRRAKEIAAETGTAIEITQIEHVAPAIATPAVQSMIEEAASALGLKTMRLPSGAGHDAQMLARVGPMGMIFVPSVSGISHSPKELTKWEDAANGANVLLQTVLLLDKQLAIST